MKIKLMMVLGVVLIACQVGATEESLVLKTQCDKENYTTGINIMRTLKQQGGVINLDIVIQGMKDELTGERQLLNEDTIRETMLALQSELTKKQTCKFIEYPDHFKAICQRDLPKTPEPSHANMQAQKNDQEQTFAALQIASLAPPMGNIASPPASSQGHGQAPVPLQEHTFAALAVQQQMNDVGETQIVLSDLTRRYGDYWVKTRPH